MLQKSLRGILVVFLLCLGVNTTYAKDNVKIVHLGELGTSYTADFIGTRAMISRDGSKAKILKKGEEITLPGKYYVCIENGKQLQIKSFTITETKPVSQWQVKSEEDLDEALKYVLGGHHEQTTLKFEYGKFSINTMQSTIQQHIEKLMLLYPSIAYAGGKIEQIGTSKPTVTIKVDYPVKSIKTMQDYDMKSLNAIEEIIEAHITSQMSVLEREQALMSALMKKITYSGQLINGAYVTNATPLSHTMWGGLVEGRAVCDGYAKSLMYCLNVVGISSQMVTGTAKGQSHAWNIVQLDNNYYHVDLTWADQDGNTVGVLPNYFNELDAYMMKTHNWDHSKYPSTSSNTYCSLFAPINMKGIYRVNNESELNVALKSIKNEALSSGTIVLYNLNANKWQKDKIIKNITSAIGKGICYTTESKYDTLIVGYNVK